MWNYNYNLPTEYIAFVIISVQNAIIKDYFFAF